jgi:hypothetical protein
MGRPSPADVLETLEWPGLGAPAVVPSV